MQIVGHELIEFKSINFIKNAQEISQQYNFIAFYYDKEIIKTAKLIHLDFAVFCKCTSEILISNCAGANIIIVDKTIAKQASKLAEYYMFDSKIGCIIDSEMELEELSILGVDTAIFKNAIINL